MSAVQTVPLPGDPALLSAFANEGSSQAFQALVERHARWVFAAAYRQLHDRQQAEDATQTVFILLFQRARVMRSPHKLTGWLFTTLQFTIKNMRRIQRRRQFREQQAGFVRALMAHDPSEAVDLSDELDVAVAALPAADRAAILLRYYQELSFEQIGETLGITQTAARKRVARGIYALRREVGRLKPGLIFSTAMIGLDQAPAQLCHTIVHTALAARAAGVLPVALAASTKGVTALMAISKMQSIGLAVCAALLFLVPASLVTIHYVTQPAVAGPLAGQPAAPAPMEAAAAPVDPYALTEGQVMKRVAAVSPETRQAMFERAMGNTGRSPFRAEMGNMLVVWDGDTPKVWGMQPQFTLKDFTRTLLREFPQDVEGDARDKLMPGDYVFRRGASIEQLRQAMATLMTSGPNENFTLSYREVPRKVAVFRGTWNYRPLRPDTAPGTAPLIQFYSSRPNSLPGSGPSGTATSAKDFALWIGSWIGQSIVLEADGVPARIDFQGNAEDGNFGNDGRIPRDPALVLNHIAEQTGLTWSEETRTVRRLFAERQSPAVVAAMAEFSRIYGLEEGEIMRSVSRPFPPSRWIAFNTESQSRPAGDLVNDEGWMIISWEPGARPWTRLTGAAGSIHLSTLVTRLLDVDSREIEAQGAILQTAFPGDVVVRNGATPEQICAGLAKLVESQNGARISLAFREVQREVYVLRGKWNYHPLDSPPPIPEVRTVAEIPQIRIYAADMAGPQWMHSAESSMRSLAINTSNYFHISLYVEAEGIPESIGYSVHYSDAATADPAVVLKHICEQTGLTWGKETRRVRRLFVEMAK